MATPEPVNLFLGFDPGGEGTLKYTGDFGWSICGGGSDSLPKRICVGLPKNAWCAIKDVERVINSIENASVRAIGIDAPLRWDKRGGRKADGRLRRALRDTKFCKSKVNGTVQAVNSLQGACVVQGTLLVEHLATMPWAQDAIITESHPKALQHLLPATDPPGLKEKVDCLTMGLISCTKPDAPHPRDKCAACKRDSHKQDATVCAVAAWAAIQKPPLRDREWQNLYCQDPGLIYPSPIPVSYWMPMPRQSKSR